MSGSLPFAPPFLPPPPPDPPDNRRRELYEETELDQERKNHSKDRKMSIANLPEIEIINSDNSSQELFQTISFSNAIALEEVSSFSGARILTEVASFYVEFWYACTNCDVPTDNRRQLDSLSVVDIPPFV